jgi:hypothetical protein
MEGGIRDALVLWGSAIAEVAFASVDPLHRITVAIEPQEFKL